MSASIESAAHMCKKPSLASQARARRMTGIVNGGVFLAVIALGVAVYFTPLKTWLAHGQFIKDQLDLFGIAAPAVFTAGCALLTAVGVPRLLLCSLAGMTFGFAFGLLWSQLGTVLGAYATFLCVRWLGKAYTMAHFPRLRKFAQNIESHGLMSVVLIRQLPVTGFYNTALIGLTPVNHGEFLLGSLLGFLPLGITACLLGAGLIQRDWLQGVQYIVLALLSSAMLGWLLRRWAKRRRQAA